MRANRHLRLIALLWGLVQATLPAGLVLGDALLMEGGSRAPTSHIENASGSGCRPVHSADCVICRVVATNFATPPVTSYISFARRIAAPLPAYRQHRSSDELRYLPLARAPPTAVQA